VSFLFTDVEGSTRLLQELGSDRYADSIASHRSVLRTAFDAHGGVEVDTQGDAFFVAFPTAPDALAAAADAIDRLAEGPIRVRVGIHTGTPLRVEEGYVGVDVHRAARIAACGHGGQVLVSASTAALVPMENLRDLGVHRLKDLSAPERIYQLGRAAFPPLKSLHRTNLPIPATSFLGRRRELAEVLALMALGEVRLLTLTGPGGTGKTRLALQAVAEASERFPDGVFWIPLAPLRDSKLVLDAAAQALDARTSLVEHIADKSMLLLFDNFEHVVDAADGLLELLATCPNLELLVTSRELLRLPGEQAYAVPPLEPGDGAQLFLARARATLPSFIADEAVPELCSRLEQLPLALELAAARVGVMSTGGLLERLSGRLDLLKAGRGVDARQQTLRATIEWSYELLNTVERRLFARLAVFAGGCTLDAAEKICNADIDTLQSLVDKSLLRYTAERFWMLETIRDYALERLESGGEMDELHRRHLTFFLAVSEEVRAHYAYGLGPFGMELVRLESEHDNFRTALLWAREAGERELTLQLAAALGPFWNSGGHFEEGRRCLVEALDGYLDAPDELRGDALVPAAWTAYKQGDLEAARTLADAAASCFRAADNTAGLAASLNLLGVVALAAGDYGQASGLLEQARSLRREIDDELGLAASIHALGLLSSAQGDYENARKRIEAGLALAQKHGARWGVANGVCDLGFVAVAQGRHEDARANFLESLRLCSELGWKEDGEYCLIGLAAVDVAAGDLQRAACLIGAAAALGDEIQLNLEPYVEDVKANAERELATRLGEQAFARYVGEGRAMSLDEAIAYVLAD
jgi:predicted ATPase